MILSMYIYVCALWCFNLKLQNHTNILPYKRGIVNGVDSDERSFTSEIAGIFWILRGL